MDITERKKGNSIIAFRDDYVVMDLETTGFSSAWDSIIEIGVIRVRGGKEVDRFVTLVRDGNPCIDDFVVQLTGITQDMLDKAPSLESVMDDFLDFVGEDIIVGQNISFDVNFVYDRVLELRNKHFDNDMIDIARISRRLYPEERHHRLADIRKRLGITCTTEHRAIEDCEVTNDAYIKLKRIALEQYGSEDEFVTLYAWRSPQTVRNVIEINLDEWSEDPESPLYGRMCCFTGELEMYTRSQARAIVEKIGGQTGDSVTKKTNLLILGCLDYCKLIKDGKSNKQKKAEKMQLDGQDIQIITEKEFVEMLKGEHA